MDILWPVLHLSVNLLLNILRIRNRLQSFSLQEILVSFSGGGSFNMLTLMVVTGICFVMTGYMGVE